MGGRTHAGPALSSAEGMSDLAAFAIFPVLAAMVTAGTGPAAVIGVAASSMGDVLMVAPLVGASDVRVAVADARAATAGSVGSVLPASSGVLGLLLVPLAPFASETLLMRLEYGSQAAIPAR
jgi:hypothetical protein